MSGISISVLVSLGNKIGSNFDVPLLISKFCKENLEYFVTMFFRGCVFQLKIIFKEIWAIIVTFVSAKHW